MSQKKIKIALLGDTLAHGGAERIHSTLSLYFEQLDFDVHNIINLDSITYPYGGVLYNLGVVKSAHFSLGNKLKRFRLFQQYIQGNSFDYILDFRTRSKPFTEVLLQHFIFDTTYIPTVHSAHLPWYFTSSSFWGKRIYRKAHSIICVSQAIAEQVKATYHYPQVQTLYNPIAVEDIHQQMHEANPFQGKRYVVACGRMDTDIKQFDRLIESYAQSRLPKQDIHLVILGDGAQKIGLEQRVEALNLKERVSLPGFYENPFPIFKEALFFVHSSRLEGFPTVFLEALACGIPVISFNCPTGPSEIIQSGYNGLLIENQNFDALQEAMEKLALDENQRINLKANALDSVRSFDIQAIGKQWLALLR
ncbi:glycosyltransferase [Myroides fluvii]|uniref:glycosyltransferase n=1 Tax=Myroides fluvii TaxID=2572594 RepID=UPI001E39AE78|nr:glycosyltransferase [Myroides fluvii]